MSKPPLRNEAAGRAAPGPALQAAAAPLFPVALASDGRLFSKGRARVLRPPLAPVRSLAHVGCSTRIRQAEGHTDEATPKVRRQTPLGRVQQPSAESVSPRARLTSDLLWTPRLSNTTGPVGCL